MTRDPKFWTCDPKAETFTSTTIREAVAEELAKWDWDQMRGRPETVTVYGYAPMTMPLSEVEWRCEGALDIILEGLDEDYADPNWDESSVATQHMRDAAKNLAAAIHADYVPWACERVEELVVNVAEVLGEVTP